EQEDALYRATRKIAVARREAAEILRQSGMPHELPTSHCTGVIPGVGACFCTQFLGSGPLCGHKFSIVSGDEPFEVSCNHPRSKHHRFKGGQWGRGETFGDGRMGAKGGFAAPI